MMKKVVKIKKIKLLTIMVSTLIRPRRRPDPGLLFDGKVKGGTVGEHCNQGEQKVTFMSRQ